jgi:hypothetical protein
MPRYLCHMQDSLALVSDTPSLALQDTAFFTGTLADTTPVELPRSLFQGHLLRPSDPGLRPDTGGGAAGWSFMVALLCVVLFSIAQRGGDSRPSIMVRAAFDRATSNHLLRYGAGADGLLSLVMIVASVLSMALFAAAVADHWSDGKASGLQMFLSATVVIAVLGVLARVMYMVLGSVFRVHHLIRAYQIDRTSMFVSTGLFLMPCSMVHFFGPSSISIPALVVGAVILALFYLKDLLRALALLWSDSQVNAIHIFYYFCALKILPLSAAFRLVTAW